MCNQSILLLLYLIILLLANVNTEQKIKRLSEILNQYVFKKKKKNLILSPIYCDL